MAINQKYSFKDFMHLNFLNVDPDEFSNSTIKGSCFYQESAYDAEASHNGSSGHKDTRVNVFPVGMHSVEFINCNLDNVKIPGPPTTIVGGSNRKLRVMNDGEDWVLDETTHKPTEPIDKERFVQEGKSVDPTDIPTEKV